MSAFNKNGRKSVTALKKSRVPSQKNKMHTPDLYTGTAKAPGKTYFFDVKKHKEGGFYLKVSCSQANATGFVHNRIIINERDLEDFSREFQVAVYQLKTMKKNQKSRNSKA